MKSEVIVRILLLVVVLSFSATAAAQELTPAPEVDRKIKDECMVAKVSFPNGVTAMPGIIFWELYGFRPLTLDLYLPPESMEKPSTGFPLVLFIHGGGWFEGDSQHLWPFADFNSVLAMLAARGYVVASTTYRFTGEAPFPAQIHDVKAAIRWLRLNTEEYGIDPTRAVTWGMSAGAHLAGMAAVSGDAEALEPVQPHAVWWDDPVVTSDVSVAVQGGVCWYGPFNMATIAQQAKDAGVNPHDSPDSAESWLVGCPIEECPPEKVAAASPVSYVDPSDPPLLLIVGDADKTVPYLQTLEMAEVLKAAGVEHELIVMPGFDHCFIGKTPEETREANHKALAATFAFIDRVIGNAPK